MSFSHRNGSGHGPKTPQGKRIAARNATTHGLFTRDIVLTHLGEDPAGYEALLAELTAQINPKNLLERHYTEKIAAASWRLRRLHRWLAQLFEDTKLPEDEILLRLDRVMRHETTLHRQIDTSVKMLARDVPQLFEKRPVTPHSPDFDLASLDNTHAPIEEPQICENEPPEPPAGEPVPDVSYVHPDGRPVYLEPAVWKNVLYCRAHGDDERADQWDTYYRQWYIEYEMNRPLL